MKLAADTPGLARLPDVNNVHSLQGGHMNIHVSGRALQQA